MKKLILLSAPALSVLLAGCSPPSSDVSPQVDGQIRNNLSRQLTPEELSQMGGGGTPKNGAPSGKAAPSVGKKTPVSAPPSNG